MAQDLIANDESEISEVVRRRLFENLGSERTRRRIASTYADWCFERSNRLPAEWTTVDTATNENRAKEALRQRFEACYPFHPATLFSFQRKWSACPSSRRPGGRWPCWPSGSHRRPASSSGRPEPNRSSPWDRRTGRPQFQRNGACPTWEKRLITAIDADIAGQNARAKPLDADAKGGAQGHPPESRNCDAL